MRRKLDAHPIAGPQPHKILDSGPGGVSHHSVLILQSQAVGCAGQQLHHLRLLAHGLVSTHGPSAVMATVCSKCAEYLPSSVTAVHLSGFTRLPGFPAFTMGSIASTMPSFKRGFSLRRST